MPASTSFFKSALNTTRVTAQDGRTRQSGCQTRRDGNASVHTSVTRLDIAVDYLKDNNLEVICPTFFARISWIGVVKRRFALAFKVPRSE